MVLAQIGKVRCRKLEIEKTSSNPEMKTENGGLTPR